MKVVTALEATTMEHMTSHFVKCAECGKKLDNGFEILMLGHWEHFPNTRPSEMRWVCPDHQNIL